MNILLTGATGFIGRPLAAALRAAGHRVIGVVRTPEAGLCDEFIHGDFTVDVDVEDWLPRVQGIEVAINAVGILRERGAQTFDALHRSAPMALFMAAAQAGVRRIVQVSALGANERARSRYHLSKKAADDFLATLPVEWTIVQPSLVFGAGGASAAMFTTLASLPVLFVPGKGEYEVQPIHRDDVIEALVKTIESRKIHKRIALVGPEPIRYRDFILRLRMAMGLRRARIVHVPEFAMRIAARCAGVFPGSLLDGETLSMLFHSNTADPSATRELLGRDARAVAESIAADAHQHRNSAQLRWLLPMLRVSIAAVWIVTGILSLGIYPQSESYALLARAGVPHSLAPLALYAGAALDLALGVATLVMRARAWLWRVQIAVILAYSVVITIMLPEFWLHPYGPILKNLPMLVAIGMLYELER